MARGGMYRGKIWESKQFSDAIEPDAALKTIEAHMRGHEAADTSQAAAKQPKSEGTAEASQEGDASRHAQLPAPAPPTWPQPCKVFDAHTTILGEESGEALECV